MGAWNRVYPFRDSGMDHEDEDFKDELKKAYHEGMKDGLELAGKDISQVSYRSRMRYPEDDGYYNERRRDMYGRYR